MNSPNQREIHGRPAQMNSGHRVRARISLSRVDVAKPEFALPSGTRSLLFQFPELDGNEPITLGALVTSDNDAALAPGGDLVASIDFWADQARTVALPGATFVVWYGGEIGRGEVLDVLGEQGETRH